jgi:hypothetical protein
MVKSTVLGKARRDADFVHALTGGHPAAARELTSRLGLAPAGFDPRFVLGARPADQVSRAGEESPTVEGDILALLRPDWVTDSDLDAMAVCGATPELRRAACSSVFRYLDWRDIDVRNLRDMLLGLGWVTGTAEDGLAIRPLPRLLLTRRLARNADLWRDAHHGYLAYYGGVHDMTAVHYHNLALTTLAEPGNLGAVAGYLDKNLPPQRPAAEWNEAVKAITAAPNRLAVVGDQRDAVKWLAGPRESGDRLRAVTRLVAARWLVHDRLLDPARRLARLVADEYYELARLAEGDTEAFYEESDYFRRIAGEWEDRP